MRKTEKNIIGYIAGAGIIIGGYFVMRMFERNLALKWFASNTKINMATLAKQDTNWILGRYDAYQDQSNEFHYKGRKKYDYADAGWYNTKSAKIVKYDDPVKAKDKFK